ncbi:tRNA (guanosine(46)-N7)-methyltransferase TrmB [Pelagibacteraceae bacterium]|nr:tRNA (guanosine(46)-N7)-methyltransferase TrmB [Pelagibacteraceae bacterium]
MLFELKKTFPKYYKYYGRRIAKKLSPSLKDIFTDNFKNFFLDEKILKNLNDIHYQSLNFNSKFKKNIIEIGFGDGKHLFSLAQENKDIHFIGCEVFINGLGKALKKIVDNNLTNISLCGLNCLYLLENIKDSSINKIFIINPDPWEKKRHFKRRLINKEFIALMYKKIENNGKVIITTDSSSYFLSILEIIKNEEIDFEETVQKILKKDDELYGISKYQKKGIEKGRNIHFVELKKI